MQSCNIWQPYLRLPLLVPLFRNLRPHLHAKRTYATFIFSRCVWFLKLQFPSRWFSQNLEQFKTSHTKFSLILRIFELRDHLLGQSQHFEATLRQFRHTFRSSGYSKLLWSISASCIWTEKYALPLFEGHNLISWRKCEKNLPLILKLWRISVNQ